MHWVQCVLPDNIYIEKAYIIIITLVQRLGVDFCALFSQITMRVRFLRSFFIPFLKSFQTPKWVFQSFLYYTQKRVCILFWHFYFIIDQQGSKAYAHLTSKYAMLYAAFICFFQENMLFSLCLYMPFYAFLCF